MADDAGDTPGEDPAVTSVPPAQTMAAAPAPAGFDSRNRSTRMLPRRAPTRHGGRQPIPTPPTSLVRPNSNSSRTW